MDRKHELEILRRSIVMLTPGMSAGLTREQALDLLKELQQVQHRLDELRQALRHLAERA